MIYFKISNLAETLESEIVINRENCKPTNISSRNIRL